MRSDCRRNLSIPNLSSSLLIALPFSAYPSNVGKIKSVISGIVAAVSRVGFKRHGAPVQMIERIRLANDLRANTTWRYAGQRHAPDFGIALQYVCNPG